jgi:hypothetical protein
MRFQTLKKISFLLSFFSGVVPFLFGMQPPAEHFFLRNHTSSVIYFTAEIGQYGDTDYYENENFVATIIPWGSTRIRANQTHYELQPARDFSDTGIYGNSFYLMSFRKNELEYRENRQRIGLTNKLRTYLKNFKVYDNDGNIIMTEEDLQEGTVTECGRLDMQGNRTVIRKEERGGTIAIKYIGNPDNFWTEVYCIIEITDELIIKGREKYGKSLS